ncbi:hypothetical protein [Hymenobacter sp. UYP22]|uniref:hypothetical protein n=1 Tax=Hymenobacter sp. UYP22 TaxID=3156348 RepID=UPI0033979F04
MTTEHLQIDGITVSLEYKDEAHKEQLVKEAREKIQAGHTWWDNQDGDGGFAYDTQKA